eukprot:scaffold128_cov328-Pavlova_lutheri.AAC.28
MQSLSSVTFQPALPFTCTRLCDLLCVRLLQLHLREGSLIFVCWATGFPRGTVEGLLCSERLAAQTHMVCRV